MKKYVNYGGNVAYFNKSKQIIYNDNLVQE